MQATWWSSMARTSCRMTVKWLPRPLAVILVRAARPQRRPPAKPRHNPETRPAARGEDRRDESVAAVHSAADRHHALDGRRVTRGLGGLPAVAHLGIAPSRLPNHSGTNVLSGGQPGSHGLIGHRAARAPVRPNSRAESDDLHEFLRELDDHAAV